MKHLELNPRLYQYILNIGIREPQVVRLLRMETEKQPRAEMMSPPEQVQFLVWLAGVTRARRILEIGTYTGYTTLWLALYLPDEGRVTTCDNDTPTVDLGRKYWKQAGMLNRIEFVPGNALESLRQFQAEGRIFDFVYVDADKENYLDYLEAVHPLIEPGGILAFDNVLWSGRVADPGISDPQTDALKTLNRKLFKDPRFTNCLIPLGDGLQLCTVR